MTHTRTLAFAFAVVAMLGAPLLQDSAQAQGRGGGRKATGGRDGGRTAAPRPGGRVAPAPRPGGRVVVARPRPLAAWPLRHAARASSSAPTTSRGITRRSIATTGSTTRGSRTATAGTPGTRGGQFYGPESALRLQVSPRNTEVFVDGYYAGTVDDFDGIFQRLRLESGEYEVTLYLPGYRTVTQRLLLQADRTAPREVCDGTARTDRPAGAKTDGDGAAAGAGAARPGCQW